jgi:hypothetical protein
MQYVTRALERSLLKLSRTNGPVGARGCGSTTKCCGMSAHQGGGGKAVHILRSYLCGLDFWMEPPFDCTDEDSGDVAFIKSTNFIEC